MPLLCTGTPTAPSGALSPVRPDLESLQGQGIHHLSGQPVPVPHHPSYKKPSSLNPVYFPSSPAIPISETLMLTFFFVIKIPIIVVADNTSFKASIALRDAVYSQPEMKLSIMRRTPQCAAQGSARAKRRLDCKFPKFLFFN